jgi:hypothetical protein
MNSPRALKIIGPALRVRRPREHPHEGGSWDGWIDLIGTTTTSFCLSKHGGWEAGAARELMHAMFITIQIQRRWPPSGTSCQLGYLIGLGAPCLPVTAPGSEPDAIR